MAINGFEGDFELSLGSVIGVRAFKVDWLGRLVGVTQEDKVFAPGVNQAECWRCGLESLATCECGFYAYFKGQDNQHMRGNPVGAIVEGTGKTVIGTKGFRTEKAQLVALFPLSRNMGRNVSGPTVRVTRMLYPTDRWFTGTWKNDTAHFWGIGSMLFGVALGIATLYGFITSDWTIGPPALVLFLWVAGFFRRMVHTDSVVSSDELRSLTRGPRAKTSKNPDPFKRLRQLYPDVPVYKSQREALKHHPLTTAEEHIPEPVLPSPETEDNFWKMSTKPGRNSTYGR